ncbi:MAG TPA: LuxR family transcriptional regulator [Chloroflexi bacterium]|jgi:predicted ATPase/DNA-binding CsgD family transcriptional regulator|nr:LuxR family transcriptional regulator [Chloroflexota bacterium]HAF18180.1 LuxR family transcriptional regulator [Chloroflexota bacterium]
MARPARRRGNLPAEATSFVGRRRELADLKRKLSSARLVSLVGPGGVGKTRLAIRAAAEVSRRFSGGAWLVELADVRDPALVGNAVMAAMDLRDQAAAAPSALLAAYLEDKQLLLVVDNCEHLLEPAAQLLSELIRVAPGLRVIATSREPLTAPGEHVMPVPPLELPTAHAERLDELRHNEAVMLFLERAEAASGTFELTAENQAAVADLCRRLDGLPLAIELAAVRTRVLSVQQILERLGDRFTLLAGGGRAALPRHQTLETAIDWSHDLLTAEERTLLRRLCVFAGRFTLEDVAAVCMPPNLPPTRALDLTSSLVDKSLVLKEDVGGAGCFRFHETMREYAGRKLGEADENDDLERRCTEYYVATCGAMALQARFRLPAWLAWMDLEIDNIRSVLRRCLVSSDSRNGISLATSLGWYWITRATTEGVRWLDELLASGPGDPATLGWSWFIRGFLAVLQGDWAAAMPPLERAITASRDAGNPVQLAHSYSMFSIAANMAGDRASALRLLDEAGSIAGEIDDVPTKVGVLQARSLNAIFEADFGALRSAATEGASLSREVGDLYALHMMNVNLGAAALSLGELDESKARYEEALRIAYQIDDRIGQYYLLAGLAFHATVAGQSKVAAQLLGASETIRLGAGATVMAVLMPILTQAEEAATAALGRSKYDAEFSAGKRLSRESAVGLALGEPHPAAASRISGAGVGLLTKREADVARLIADGLSNKQIGARLFISERTADSHVRSILNKLGFSSRAQIASWIASAEQH